MADTVQVDPWVILYAFRYGLGRPSAHDDALALVRRYWPDLRQWSDSIVGDLRALERVHHPMLSEREVREAVGLAEWCEGQ